MLYILVSRVQILRYAILFLLLRCSLRYLNPLSSDFNVLIPYSKVDIHSIEIFQLQQVEFRVGDDRATSKYLARLSFSGNLSGACPTLAHLYQGLLWGTALQQQKVSNAINYFLSMELVYK